MFNTLRENIFGIVPRDIEKFGSNQLCAAYPKNARNARVNLQKSKNRLLKPILFNALCENIFGIIPLDIEKFGSNRPRAANLNFRKKHKG